jgi:hydroxymethylpyrimidine/phosphomethylpyrimidine kinase
VPDFVTEEEVGEIKDSKKVSNTRQMRAEREVAKDQEKDHVIITGNNTQITRPLEQSGSK